MHKFLLLAATAVALATPAQAQSDATLYIGHGINGTDIGLSENLPVDVTVNGGVLLTGFEFRSFTDALSLAPGAYSIQISPADPGNPGSQPPLIDVTVDLFAGENATILAHLDETGAAVATKFVNPTSIMMQFGGLLSAQHTAWAPAVDIRARRLFSSNTLIVPDVTNGLQAAGELKSGVYGIDLVAAGTTTRVLGPAFVPVLPQGRTALYVVGSLGNSTLEIISLSY